jgi:hypothetical protein
VRTWRTVDILVVPPTIQGQQLIPKDHVMENAGFSPVDCAAAETGDARITNGPDDRLHLSCLCGLEIVAGVIVERGYDRDPQDISATWWPMPEALSVPNYRRPGELRYLLRLVPVRPAAGDPITEAKPTPPEPGLPPITSLTIRFNRAHQAPDGTR